MKKTPNKLFEQLSKEFTSKKEKEAINEELGKIVELKPLVQLEPTAKEPFWTKFESFIAEGNSLEPIVNDDMKYNTKEGDERYRTMSSANSPDIAFVGEVVEDSHNLLTDQLVENLRRIGYEVSVTRGI